MHTLTSHYNVVLHHFVSTVCCVMAGVSCQLSVCSRVYQCVLSAWHTTTVLPSLFRGVHCTPSKSLATAVCVPLSLPSHYHSTSPHLLPHLPTPHLPLYTALIPTAHSPHTLTTHVLHTWHCVTLVHAVCESPSPCPVHSTLHQSLSSPRLTCSGRRCMKSTRDSK